MQATIFGGYWFGMISGYERQEYGDLALYQFMKKDEFRIKNKLLWLAVPVQIGIEFLMDESLLKLIYYDTINLNRKWQPPIQEFINELKRKRREEFKKFSKKINEELPRGFRV